MKQVRYTIHDPNGLHARPAGLLVKEAQKYPCAIQLAVGKKGGLEAALLPSWAWGQVRGHGGTHG